MRPTALSRCTTEPTGTRKRGDNRIGDRVSRLRSWRFDDDAVALWTICKPCLLRRMRLYNRPMGPTIGKAARDAGVNVETIRFYERRGLIDQPRKTGTDAFRRYPPETIARIRFIQRAKTWGFSLREIGDLLRLESQEGADCGDVQARASAKVQDINARIDELTRIRDALERAIAGCPGSGTSLQGCSILAAFAGELSCANKADKPSS